MSNTDQPILIQMRLTGMNISPGKMRSKDLAELIKATEAMIATYISKKHPEISSDEVVVGLTGIEKGSCVLQYEPSLRELTIPAIEEISQCIENKRIESLPSKTIECIREIRKIAVKRKLNAEFYTLNGTKKYLTAINESIEIPKSFSLSGETTIYGKIIRVGGKEPKITISTISGEILTCTAKMSIVRQAGKRIYDMAGIRGVAQWDIETMEIKEFDIIEFTEYEDIPVCEAFDKIRDDFGAFFEHIQDPVEYYATIRGED